MSSIADQTGGPGPAASPPVNNPSTASSSEPSSAAAHTATTATEAEQEPSSSSAAAAAAEYEATHVHSVYQAIAPHFSATRHKPWPRVAAFLQAQPPGSIGLDVGCGNGKYLDVNPRLHILGSDRSEALIRLARTRFYADTKSPAEGLVADGLDLPYRASSVDFVISIAVVHHLSTNERRRAAVKALLECARPGAPVLVFAWALEQASSRRGFHAGCEQDTLVSWVMKTPKVKGQPVEEEVPDKTYERYYHLYREGELEEDVRAVGGVVVEAGYERDNWWVVCSREDKEEKHKT